MSNISQHRRAVIDVGTNSVKLLVGDVAGGVVTPVFETSKQTRLGAGFYETRRLQAPAIAATAAAVAEFSKAALQLDSSLARVIATSAARDAINADELSESIQRASGLEMEVISGDQEADWVFRGVATNPNLGNLSALVLDIGGGSTEFIVGENGVSRFRKSYSLGTVRLLERLRPGDPPGLKALKDCRADLREFLKAEVERPVKAALSIRRPVRLVGTGGTATLLARIEAKMTGFDREKIESTELTLEGIRRELESEWQMTQAERQKIVGLPANRSDVILTGIAICEAIMEVFEFSELTVSTRGLRYWALIEPPKDKKKTDTIADALP